MLDERRRRRGELGRAGPGAIAGMLVALVVVVCVSDLPLAYIQMGKARSAAKDVLDFSKGLTDSEVQERVASAVKTKTGLEIAPGEIQIERSHDQSKVEISFSYDRPIDYRVSKSPKTFEVHADQAMAMQAKK